MIVSETYNVPIEKTVYHSGQFSPLLLYMIESFCYRKFFRQIPIGLTKITQTARGFYQVHAGQWRPNP
jgi:hypothetical protein